MARVLAALLLVACVSAQPLPRMFSPTEASEASASAGDVTTSSGSRRVLMPPKDVELVTKGPGKDTPLKEVTIGHGFINTLPDSFVFTLPTGQDLTVTRRTDMPRRRNVEGTTIQTWTGNVADMSPVASSVTLQVMPSGKLYGTLHFLDTTINANRNFLVRPIEGTSDSYLLAEFGEPDVREDPPLVHAPSGGSSLKDKQRARAARYRRARAGAATQVPPEAQPLIAPAAVTSGAPGEVTTAAVGDTVIDLLIVFTPQVVAAKGSVDAVLADGVGAVDKANAAYLNSKIPLQLNAVAVRQVNYTCSTVDWNTDLNALTNNNVPSVQQWREDLGADMVTMIIEKTDFCGLGWVIADPTSTSQSSYAFSLVSYSCWNGYHSMAHELGHNMGAMHDRTNAGGSGTFSYSYGYQEPTNKWRTIMAYNCPVNCPRLNYFSNPSVSYGGVAMGVAQTASDSADNAATLRYTTPYIAKFRATKLACPSGQKLCGTSCIVQSGCCADTDCAATEFCNATNACTAGCRSGFKQCGTTCIAQSSCCNSTDCSGGQTCAVAGGACACPSGQKLCGTTCIAQSSCCNNTDCSGGQTCAVAGGTCACPSGKKLCGTTCIAQTSCCNNTDCSGGLTCPAAGGACACPQGQKLCGGACVSSSFCCAASECVAPKTCPKPLGSAACQAPTMTLSVVSNTQIRTSTAYTKCSVTFKVADAAGAGLSSVSVKVIWSGSTTVVTGTTVSGGTVSFTKTGYSYPLHKCTTTVQSVTLSPYVLTTTLPLAVVTTW